MMHHQQQQYSSRYGTPTSVPAPHYNNNNNRTTTTTTAVAPSSPEMATSSSAATSHRSTPLIPASTSHHHHYYNHHHHRQHQPQYTSSSLGPSESNSPLSFHYPLDAPPTKPSSTNTQHQQQHPTFPSTSSTRIPSTGTSRFAQGSHHHATTTTLSRCSSVQGGDSRMCSPVLLLPTSGSASPQHHHQQHHQSSRKFPSPVPISSCGSRLPRPPSGGGDYRVSSSILQGCGGGGWEGTRLRSPSSCSFSYQDEHSGQMEGCSPPSCVTGGVEAISSTYDQFSPPRLLPRFTSGMGARVVCVESPTAPSLHRSSAPRSVRRVLRVVSSSASKQAAIMTPTHHHDAPSYRSLGGNTPPPLSCASTPLVSPARSAIGCEEGYSVRRGIVGISLFRTTPSHQDVTNTSSSNAPLPHMTTPDKVMAIRDWGDTCHRPTPHDDAYTTMYGDEEEDVPCRPSKNRSMRQPLFDSAAIVSDTDVDEEVIVVQQQPDDCDDELFEGTISGGGSGEDADVEVRNRRYVDLDVTFNEDDDTEVVGMTAEGEFLLRVSHKTTMSPPNVPAMVVAPVPTSSTFSSTTLPTVHESVATATTTTSECRIVPIAHTTSASSSLLPKPTPRPTPTSSTLLHAASTSGTLCPPSSSSEGELVSATPMNTSSSLVCEENSSTTTALLAPLTTSSADDVEMRTTTPLELVTSIGGPSSLTRPMVSASRRAPRCYRVLKASGSSSSAVDLSNNNMGGGGVSTPCDSGKTPRSGLATPSARAFAQPIFGTPTTTAASSRVVSPQRNKMVVGMGAAADRGLASSSPFTRAVVATHDDEVDTPTSSSPQVMGDDCNLSATCKYAQHSPTAAPTNHHDQNNTIDVDDTQHLPLQSTTASSPLSTHLMRLVSDSPSLTSTMRPDPVIFHNHPLHRAVSPTITSFSPPPPLCTPPTMHPLNTTTGNFDNGRHEEEDDESPFSPLPTTAAIMATRPTTEGADAMDGGVELSAWERRRAMILRGTTTSSARSSSSPSLTLPTISHTPWSRSGSQVSSSMTGMRRGRCHNNSNPFGVDPRGITFLNQQEDDLSHHMLGRAHSAADSTHYEDMHLANHTLGAASHLFSQHHHPKASDRFGSVDAVDVALQKKSRDYFAELKRYRKLKGRLEDRENYPRPDRILQKLMLIEAKWQAQAHQKLVEDSTSMFSTSSLL